MSVPTMFKVPSNLLFTIGLPAAENLNYQLAPAELIAQCLERKEGVLSDSGALVIHTGRFTGRSPKDRFIVEDAVTASSVDWNDTNQPIGSHHFDGLCSKMTAYLRNKEIWVRDSYACADPEYRLSIRIVNEDPCSNLFAYNMFLRPSEDELRHFEPAWTVIHAPGFYADPKVDGTRQENFTIINFGRRIVLIGGSAYTGEIKKSVFSLLNFLLPREKGVMSIHCSANVGTAGDTALFLGLSGTGKTTLSADPARKLVGDDEHGWSDSGVFNFEGGCYAKTINLNCREEPEIFGAIREGALVENVTFFPGTRKINFESSEITENTRVSYPIDFIANAMHPSLGRVPKNIFLLTADAYGILPPISKLTAGQAMYQFMSGYTAKVAGTEEGIREPKPVFSACFASPFIPLHPAVYAAMLGKKMKEKQVNVWMVNTGWTGGPYGVGTRMKIAFTRAMIHAALDGKLENVEFDTHPVFGLNMPKNCPGVPAALLNPRNTWTDVDDYDRKARELAQKFIANFKKFESHATAEMMAAAPCAV